MPRRRGISRGGNCGSISANVARTANTADASPASSIATSSSDSGSNGRRSSGCRRSSGGSSCGSCGTSSNLSGGSSNCSSSDCGSDFVAGFENFSSYIEVGWTDNLAMSTQLDKIKLELEARGLASHGREAEIRERMLQAIHTPPLSHIQQQWQRLFLEQMPQNLPNPLALIVQSYFVPQSERTVIIQAPTDSYLQKLLGGKAPRLDRRPWPWIVSPVPGTSYVRLTSYAPSELPGGLSVGFRSSMGATVRLCLPLDHSQATSTIFDMFQCISIDQNRTAFRSVYGGYYLIAFPELWFCTPQRDYIPEAIFVLEDVQASDYTDHDCTCFAGKEADWHDADCAMYCVTGDTDVLLANNTCMRADMLSVGMCVQALNADHMPVVDVVEATITTRHCRPCAVVTLPCGGVLTSGHPVLRGLSWCRARDVCPLTHENVPVVFNFVLRGRNALLVKGRDNEDYDAVGTLGQFCEGVDFPGSFFGSERVVEAMRASAEWPVLSHAPQHP